MTSFVKIDFGAPMPPFFARLLHLRLSNARSANVLRKTLLGHRFTAPELLEEGIVDEIVPGKQLQERAIAFGNEIGQKSKGGSWGEMKVSLLLMRQMEAVIDPSSFLIFRGSPITTLSRAQHRRQGRSCPRPRPRNSSSACKRRVRSGSTVLGKRLGQSCDACQGIRG